MTKTRWRLGCWPRSTGSTRRCCAPGVLATLASRVMLWPGVAGGRGPVRRTIRHADAMPAISRTNRLMSIAAVISLAAHLALLAALPGPAANGTDSPPMAVELQAEPPPPAKLPPRRLPPKPRPPKPAEATPPAPAAAPSEAPAPAAEPGPPAPEPAPAGPPAAPVAEPAPPLAEPPPTVAEEAPAEEEAAPLMALQGLAKSADLRFNLLRGDGKVGELVWRWRKDGKRYSIETVGTASGLAALFFGGEYRQTSEGTLGPNGLTPERYTFERGSADKLDVIRFDWTTSKAQVNDAKGRSRELDLVPGTQDLMSFLHQLPLLPAESISIPLATLKKVKDYSFSTPQTVRVKVPAGELEAYYYQRIGTETEAEVWLQHQPPFLPIRLRLFDKLGNRFEQVLTGIEYQP
ncbi:MAG: DUF3108 domain-containing protein [Rhodocyclaceae bacterium]|nr:DUF3108 domain-containing protein [Rhodocyclaceae bacterium]